MTRRVRLLACGLILTSVLVGVGVGVGSTSASAALTGPRTYFGPKQYPTVFQCYTSCAPRSIGIQPAALYDLEATWTLNNVGIWLFMDDPNHTNSTWYCPCYASPSTTFFDYLGNNAGTQSPPAGRGCGDVTYDPTQTWAGSWCRTGYVQDLAYQGLPAGTGSTAFTIFPGCSCAQGFLNYSPPYTYPLTPGSIGRSVGVINSNPGSGQIMYGQGRVFPFTNPPAVMPAITTYQFDWDTGDIARQIVMCPTNGGIGYLLDGYGGVRQLTSASAPITRYTYWGWDIARSIVLRADCQSGYVLDGWGAVHPFASDAVLLPPVPQITSYWQNWDIAHWMDYIGPVNGVDSGYVLDGYGGVHPWGNAPQTYGFPYWSGWDIARAIVTYDNGTGGYVLDGFGGVHSFGGAPVVQSNPGYWNNRDIARGLAMQPFARRGYYLDSTTGGLWAFTT